MPREEIEPRMGDKRYVRRDDQGQFKKEVDEGRSLTKDRQQHAKRPSPSTAKASLSRNRP
jgi:hypothetical protein